MKKLLIFIAILGIGLSVIGCNSEKEELSGLSVVSTIGMINDIVINVGKDHVRAVSLMGPGVDPHLYKPVASDVHKLLKADVVFYNGLHLEAKMGEVLEKMGETKAVEAVTQALPKDILLSSLAYENLPDPHVWFDVMIWYEAVDVVANALAKADPENASEYSANAGVYKEGLLKTNASIKARIAMLDRDKRILVTAHDAFRYFGKAYGFTVKGLQGISTATEAGTRDVQELVGYIVEHKIPAIFIESSIPKRTIEAVQAACQAQGWNVEIGGELFADAMGDPGTEEGTYMGMVKHNVDVIVSALLMEKH